MFPKSTFGDPISGCATAPTTWESVQKGSDVGFSSCAAPIYYQGKYFMQGWELKPKVWVSLWYDRVQCLDLSPGFEEPKGDECRVEWKAIVWRSGLRTRVTSDWCVKWEMVTQVDIWTCQIHTWKWDFILGNRAHQCQQEQGCEVSDNGDARVMTQKRIT